MVLPMTVMMVAQEVVMAIVLERVKATVQVVVVETAPEVVRRIAYLIVVVLVKAHVLVSVQ